MTWTWWQWTRDNIDALFFEPSRFRRRRIVQWMVTFEGPSSIEVIHQRTGISRKKVRRLTQELCLLQKLVETSDSNGNPQFEAYTPYYPMLKRLDQPWQTPSTM